MGERTAPESIALVQELVNTLDVETGRDALSTAEDLAAFARRNGLAELGVGAADLPALRTLREALRAACRAHAGTEVPPAERTALAGLLAGAPLVLEVDAAGGAQLRPTAGLTGAAGLTAHIAAGIAEASAAGDWQRLKACEAADCRWAFYDRSPAGRGRWCSMAVCGSRAKMRAYRARRG
ncbi:CGNR zinc finger domain-containing protein [Streptomyces sp. JJ36]|uniref:CGNR zinc finger domain-containing protein n=1 Tax=Streptomyces sp. JJ36 TaxID=2736645 RepID=UPI001F1DF6BC|nr:CGNR zinc finger domain-containing protein [Streptomyces sp. JJ36]MCF6524027.1 CGNR zinc finger domain-containing protein [Streptomyces sp. JJ36]